MNNEIIHKLENLLSEAKFLREHHAYAPPISPEERRNFEHEHSTPGFSWEENGHSFYACTTVACSDNYIYVIYDWLRDGKATTRGMLENSLDRMKKGVNK